MIELERNRKLDEPSNDMHANLFSGLMQQVTQGATLDTVLNSVYDNFNSILPFNRIGCALVDESGVRVVARWCRSEKKVILGKNYSAPLKGSSLQFVLEQNRPRILNNLEEYLQKHPHSVSTRLIVNEGIRSSFTFPLTVEGHGIGFLFFSSIETNAYSKAHLALFKEIAGLLSLAILIASQRKQTTKSHNEYISLLNRLISSASPRSEHVVQLVSDLAPGLSPKHIEHYETAAILIETRDFISTTNDREHEDIVEIINQISELETVSTIIELFDNQNDLLSLKIDSIRNEPLSLAANLIRTVQEYKNLEHTHSSNHLPFEHLRRQPEVFAPFIVDELEQAIIASVSETTQRVSIKELVDGMIFKEHVVASDGAILVSSHHIVNGHIRERLENYGNNGMRVMEPLLVTCPPEIATKSKLRGPKRDRRNLCSAAR
ncbi:GAF domain-containing protein [uncultured Gimesia sp.]|uniref:GAF domain-containing protein n=1 Tax=uncultured Gimesia sp. TaxID=1678688 RepID=UPI0030D89FBB|tara:strand:+ start:42098 stop:43399 length:1302 start_codon:yes stop_codon:yes gene_type:complete